jgi:hypothetical protein
MLEGRHTVDHGASGSHSDRVDDARHTTISSFSSITRVAK